MFVSRSFRILGCCFGVVFFLACTQNAKTSDVLAGSAIERLPSGEYSTAAGVRLIRQEIAALKKAGGLDLRFPGETSPLSASLAKFSPSLKEAAQEVKRLIAPFHERVEKVKPTIGFQANQESFAMLATDLVEQVRPVKAEEFFAYKWAGGCGTGSEQLYGERSIWVWLSLLREKRYTEAVGAAIFLTDQGFGRSDFFDVAFEFLNLCGVDIPKVGAGMLVLSGEERVEVPRNKVLALDFLASRSGKRELDWAKELTSDRALEGDAIRLLSEWVAPKLNDGGFEALHAVTPAEKPLREEILQFLETRNKEWEFGTAKELTKHFEGKKCAEAKPLLQNLVGHPSGEVSRKAAEVLRGMGETVAVPPQKEIVFQLLNNGVPLKNSRVVLAFEGVHRATYGTTITTNDRGEMMLEQSRFQDPGWKIERIVFSSDQTQHAEEALYAVTFPVPHGATGLEERQTVEIATKPMELEISPAPFLSKEERASVKVKIDDPSFRFGTKICEVTGANEKLCFPAVEGKNLRVTVSGPKIALSTTQVELSNGEVLKIPLERGADLTFNIVAPKGRGYVDRLLTRDGKAWDMNRHFVHRYKEGPIWKGLPKGDYVLRFFPGRDLFAKAPDSAAKEGLKVQTYTFRIDDGSPPVIDLGVIDLPSS